MEITGSFDLAGLTLTAAGVTPPAPPPPPRALYAWGVNGSGQLGLGDTVNRSSPVQIGTDTTWTSATFGYFSVAVKTNGTLWAWGQNNYGGLGQNDTQTRSSPVQVGTLTDWAAATNNNNGSVLAVKTDGTLWAWGDNFQGQLGLGSTTYFSSPVQVGTGTNWSSALSMAGYSSLAIKTDGTLWAWGNNDQGQLALGDTANRSSPVQVGNGTTWSKIFNCVGLKTDGTIWTWGNGTTGGLGHNNTNSYSSPVQVGTNTNWTQVSSGANVSSPTMAAIKSDDTLWVWGLNSQGQLGLGDSLNRSSPVQVGTGPWIDISVSQSGMNAIKSDGTLWAWGENNQGQLGQGNTTDFSSPVQVGTSTAWSEVSKMNGSASSGAISAEASPPPPPPAPSYKIYGFGKNDRGQTLNLYGSNKLVPTTNYPAAEWASLAGANGTGFGIKSDGSLWSWGYNQLGNMGIGNADQYAGATGSPTRVGTGTNWRKVVSGADYAATAIKTDGTLWSWGAGGTGVLGNNTENWYSSPIQVGTDTNWADVFAGRSTRFAIRNDGTLWSWGQNNRGQLGQNSVTYRSSPVQVGNQTTWLNSNIDGGNQWTLAVKSDGTLWSWGYGGRGALGQGVGAYQTRSSPVQVGANTNWASVTAGIWSSHALDTSGHRWVWGYNVNGIFGDGSYNNTFASPVQMGTTVWSSLVVASESALGVRSDGTLWTWGSNSNGQLGIGGTTYFSSPVQVGSATDWVSTLVAGQMATSIVGKLSQAIES